MKVKIMTLATYIKLYYPWLEQSIKNQTNRLNTKLKDIKMTEPNENPLSYQVGGDHYKKYDYQPIEFFNDVRLDFNRANAIKYLARWKDKGGVEDLKKAVQYLRFAEQEQYKRIRLEVRFAKQFGIEKEGEIIDQILDRRVVEARKAIEDLIYIEEAKANAEGTPNAEANLFEENETRKQ